MAAHYDVKSRQRRTRILAFRIEGSTGTPSIEGLDKNQVTVADTAEGTYTVTFNKAFAQAPHATASCEAVDKVATLTTTASTVIVKVNDVDETPNLSDGDVQVIVFGHDITDQY